MVLRTQESILARRVKRTMKGMCERARVLLCMIDENTEYDMNIGELIQCFHTENNEFYVSFQKEPVILWEQRDGAILASLIRKNLISRCDNNVTSKTFVSSAYGHLIAVKCLETANNRSEGQ